MTHPTVQPGRGRPPELAALAGRPVTVAALAAVVLGVVMLALAAGPARAQSPAPSSGPIGFDVSYPLCGKPYPAGQAFAIVGVNAGLANDANPCLASELAWAAASPGSASPPAPPASLYLNAADPGNGVPDWPSPATGAATPTTPYGPCDGSWSEACGYLYGVERAVYSYQLAAAAGGGVAPTTAPWWLDIESLESWATPAAAPTWAALNVATIQGFVGGLRASGATGPVGFYSTPFQWQAITGLSAATSPQQFATSSPDWIAGVGSFAQARAACATSFSGGAVTLAQFSAAGLDADYACPAGGSSPPAAAAGLEITSHTLTRTQLTLTGTIAPTYRGHVEAELEETHRGATVRVRKSAAARGGRWSATIRLPHRYRGLVSSATALATSSAQDGLKAGRAELVIHLRG